MDNDFYVKNQFKICIKKSLFCKYQILDFSSSFSFKDEYIIYCNLNYEICFAIKPCNKEDIINDV
ncbi:hypothetical protein [Clostridium sp. UBA6640]|uniref:hypothetical protein n=1 Tax=Clostridium sp. UBA6640 TaxID=1946370 RepID=UPI0025BF532A|nr:hypothetical protein [Clostridium sp. UBA6640]